MNKPTILLLNIVLNSEIFKRVVKTEFKEEIEKVDFLQNAKQLYYDSKSIYCFEIYVSRILDNKSPFEYIKNRFALIETKVRPDRIKKNKLAVHKDLDYFSYGIKKGSKFKKRISTFLSCSESSFERFLIYFSAQITSLGINEYQNDECKKDFFPDEYEHFSMIYNRIRNELDQKSKDKILESLFGNNGV